MLNMKTASPASGRAAGRWFGVVSVAAVLALGIAGCSADPSVSSKSLDAGQENVEIGPMPDIDPASIEGIAFGTASVEAGGAVTDFQPEVLPGTEMPGADLKASKREDSGLASRVHLWLAAGDNITKLGNEYSKAHSDCGSYDDEENSHLRDLPFVVESVAAGGMQESCIEADGDAFVQATYKIGDSPYLLWTYAKTPRVGSNEVKCTILNAKDWKETKNSPYSCTTEWLQDGGHGLNPMPKIKLWKKIDVTVTDPAQVEQILSANCKTAGPNCVYHATVQKFMQLPKKQWIPYGNPQGNCIPNSEAKLTVGDEQKVTWKKMIGVTASGEMEIGPVKAGLKASYEYAWGAETSFKEEHEMTVPEGKIAGFFIAAGVLHVEGDFTVSTPSAIYHIPNATFNLPLTADYNDGDTVIRKGPILPAAWDCPSDDAAGNLSAAQTPEFGLPDGAELLDPAKVG